MLGRLSGLSGHSGALQLSTPVLLSVSLSAAESWCKTAENPNRAIYSFPGSPRLTLGMGPTHIPNTRWSSTGQTVVEQGHRAYKESKDHDIEV